MSHTRLTPIITLMCAALTLGGLSGCGGSSDLTPSSGDTTASQQVTPTPDKLSDEQAVRQQAESDLGTFATPELYAAGMRADPDIAEMETLGFDVDSVASSMAAKIQLEVTNVAVEADTAIVGTSLTVPNFDEASDTILEEAIAEKTAGLDVASMTEEEMMVIFMEVLTEVLTSPDLPLTTSSYDIEYVRAGDGWQMADPEAVEQAISSLAGTE